MATIRTTHVQKYRFPRLILGFFVGLLVSVCVATVAMAESRTVGNTTGETWHQSGLYRAKTTASYQHYLLYVNIRAWGATPNPLKDFAENTAYSTQQTQPVSVSDTYYGVYVSQHASQIYPGGSTTTLYTSGTGCQSSYCWWSAGTQGGCSSTCD